MLQQRFKCLPYGPPGAVLGGMVKPESRSRTAPTVGMIYPLCEPPAGDHSVRHRPRWGGRQLISMARTAFFFCFRTGSFLDGSCDARQVPAHAVLHGPAGILPRLCPNCWDGVSYSHLWGTTLTAPSGRGVDGKEKGPSPEAGLLCLPLKSLESQHIWEMGRSATGFPT